MGDSPLKESFSTIYGLFIDPLNRVMDWFNSLGNI